MPPSELKIYQQQIVEGLRCIYSGSPVKSEWATMSNERNMYSPRVDIAVGPFAVRELRFENDYDILMENSRRFIQKLISYHLQNVRSINGYEPLLSFSELKFKNINARCLLIIEIENKVSRKHLMGGAINAAALGRIGIAVAWTEDKLRAFIKLMNYLHFLGSVGKNTFDTGNLLILNRHQLLQAIHDSRNRA